MKNAIFFLIGFAIVAALMLALDGGINQADRPDFQAYTKPRVDLFK